MVEDPNQKPNPLDGSDYKLSPELEKERKKTEIPVSGKRMLPRVIAFVVLLGVGITFMVLGILGFFSAESGLVAITVNEESGYRAGTEINFYYYLSGSSREVNVKSSEISNVYSKAMKDAYRLTEDEFTFDGCDSLGRVNAHPNETLTIDSRLYDILADATTRMGRDFYNAPLYRDWQKFMRFSMENLANFDPSVNPPEQAYIDSMVSLLSDESAVKLVLLGQNQVQLQVSSEALAWKNEYEYQGPWVTLGLMRNAYRIEYVKKELLAKGFADGMLLSEDGILASLGGLKNIKTNVYGFSYLQDSYAGVVGTLQLNELQTVSLVSHVGLGKQNDGWAYTLFPSDAENIRLRSLHIDPKTGEGYQDVTALMLASSTYSVPEVRAYSLLLAGSSGQGEIAAVSMAKHLTPIYCLKGETKTIHASTAVASAITLDTAGGYSILTD